MNAKLAVSAFAMAGIIVTLVTAAALSNSTTVPLSGTANAVNVEVYSDSARTQPVTSINVGNVNPGSTVTQTIYIKNSGTKPVTLSMVADDWNPTAATSYLTLAWNRQDYVLDVGDSVSATLTLSATSDIEITAFRCNVTFIGTE